MYTYQVNHVFYFKPFKLVITNKPSPKTKKGSHCFKIRATDSQWIGIGLGQFVSMFIHLFWRFVRSASFSINLELINNWCALFRYVDVYVHTAEELHPRSRPCSARASSLTRSATISLTNTISSRYSESTKVGRYTTSHLAITGHQYTKSFNCVLKWSIGIWRGVKWSSKLIITS